MKKQRLQKILAHAGYGSRRSCEELITAGRVAVDGKVATLGDQADPIEQQITLDDKPIRIANPKHIYVMLHKPRAVISTVSDQHGRRTVRDLIALRGRIYPVGRLDAKSEGLILLTDDGQLTQQLTHPKYKHPRVYRVLVSGNPTEQTLQEWKKGIVLNGKRVRCDAIKVEQQRERHTWLRITVHEGRKHLVRRLVAALGHPVQRLIRVQMGPIRIGNLKPGEWRHLRPREVEALLAEINPEKKKPRKRKKHR
ncbi:MAG: rRNA pseudouridine synthase [Anaerolineae bacterium]|nr:rRNA pseudouridine synthase [Anaerolineae bacterium]